MVNLSLGETQFASYGNKISRPAREREREGGRAGETEKERRGEVLFFRYLIKSFAIHRARDSGTSRRFIEVAESFAANKINH